MYLSWHMGWNLVDSRDTRWIKICPLGSGSAFTEVMKWLLATASVVFSMRYMWDWVRPSVIQQQRLQLHIHATHKTVSRQFYVTCSPNKDCVVCGRPLQGRYQNLSGFVNILLVIFCCRDWRYWNTILSIVCRVCLLLYRTPFPIVFARVFATEK